MLTLKRAYADGTVAVEMDPLSLLCRLATSVPPPRFHTVKGVHASASPWRLRIAPRESRRHERPKPKMPSSHPNTQALYRARAELLKRTFDIDVLDCPKCHGRMKLLAMITDGASGAR